jgi:hypothetical protein
MSAGLKTSSVPLQRMTINYPETHCVLIDRQLFPDNLFEDVEPFDADLGLTRRKRRLTTFLEPHSVAMYVAPPPLEVCDIEEERG